MSALPVLRLNQGDASEARIYYCAHFVAQSLGFFEAEGVEVQFQTTDDGGQTVRGGQIPAVLSGAADLTVGGPMVTMKMLETGEARLSSFCAVAAGNPWVLAGRPGGPAIDTITGLKGLRIIDVANVGTATLTFRWLLDRNGLRGSDVTLIPGSGDATADLDKVANGEADLALHSLHALAPVLATGKLTTVMDLSRPTGLVPWSAYIARPERLGEAAFAAFTRAIARAQDWMRRTPAAEIAALVAPHYDQPEAALALSLEGYRASGVLALDPVITDEEFDRFAGLLTDIGWIGTPPRAADLVNTTLALAARAAIVPTPAEG